MNDPATDPRTKPEIIAQLRQVQAQVAETVLRISPAQFERGSAASWSPSDYLRHLLLSVKPVSKALGFPPAALRRRFGEVTHPPQDFAQITARYRARLDEGVRAEDYENVTPAAFRIPETMTDPQAGLVAVWHEAHEKLYAGLENWSEADLDAVQMLHPALGGISVREMLFFTIAHNRLHGEDIRKAGSQ